MLASLSDNTKKQYSVSYKAWWQFCNINNINPFEGTVAKVISFLTEQFNKGASYGSLNSHRSALSLLLGNNIGSDECVKRLLKGAYKLKPSKPKYTHTWDPQLVLNHVSNWYPNRDLDLYRLTKKLVILLALCTAQRVQTLSLIKLENINISSTGIKIIITDIIKTSAPGREQPVLFLPYFVDNTNICPATVLSDYIYATKTLRNKNSDNLILTIKKPNRAATAQTISRWIKLVLSESGVDTSIFSAHSTRHASTSSASSAGVCIDTIRRTAGWTSRSHTFAKFYKLNIINEAEFAESVCLSFHSNHTCKSHIVS
ncbi:uncharacterized protein LOC124637219 [Helicoverpa zea]|uniref:uncharacterized protein LOC124637219 n=1 Tax=Helicoverpa zea TaxID=7113 RepID=UPI001F579169|nr:uncharacterized protein LOC124637219 [Helicoverpa zea]